ncbi:MAG: lytic transglycosylase domain-containing protein [Gemmatimonadota bacterium]
MTLFTYFWKLGRSVFDIEMPTAARVRAAVTVPCVVLLIFGVTAGLRAPATALGILNGPEKSKYAVLLDRSRALDESLKQVEAVYESEVLPLERVLLDYNQDQRLVRRVAAALVGEGRRAGLSPDILLAVLLVENPDLAPGATSFVGAQGLMQVMPLHRGNWRACAQNMDSIEGNICYGAQIFKDNLRASGGDIERALLRYNGCVKGTNTPTCGQYPYHVFARAGKAAMMSKMGLGVAP